MNKEKIKLDGTLYDSENLDRLFRDNEPFDSWHNAIFFFLKNWFDNTVFILAQTSGSTGKPKEIKLAKNAMRNSARMTNNFFEINETKTALLCLPATYIAGKMMLVRAIVGGYNLITVEPRANPFENINTKIDFAAITPYQLNYSAETLKTKPVENIIVGGGHVSIKLEEIAQSIPAKMFETYGMTETCSHIALRQFNGGKKSDYFNVLKGVSIRLDERNCLVINAPHLHKNEIVTNDFVEISENNTFLWLGRFDTTINTGGIKIHPEQIEKKLEGIIPTNFFISTLPDDILENKVILIIECETYSEKQSEYLNLQMKNLLSKFEIPKQVFFMPNFSYSQSNKILRNETQKRLQFID